MPWLMSFLATIRTGTHNLLDYVYSTAKAMRRSVPAYGTSGLLVLLLVTGPGSPLVTGLGIGTVYAAGNAKPNVSHDPNTLSNFRSSGNAWGQSADKTAPDTHNLTVGHGKGPGDAPASTGKPSAHPISIGLENRFFAVPTSNSRAHVADVPATSTPINWYKSQEGMLEVGLAEGSLDLSQATIGGKPLTVDPLTAPAGSYVFNFTQTQGGFRGEMVQLARFDLHLQDAQGHTLDGVRFSQPLILRLHYAKHELDGLNPFDIALYWPATADTAHAIGAASVPLTIDPKNQTLTAQVTNLHKGATVLAATSTDANQASSEHLRMDDNQGDVSFSVPLNLPPAAGGLAPNLQLVYSSAGPNGRNSRLAPAPATGDGWNLSLGSISYDSSTNMYYLNGVGGVSDPLLCCMTDGTGTNYFVPHHHPNVRVYTASNTQDPATANSDASCFKVHTPDGLQYDLGCTQDSRRKTLNSGGTALVAYEWDVDGVSKLSTTSSTILQKYFIVYWQDVSTINGMNVTRDSVPGEIDYNYSGGQPQARVYVNVHWPGANQWLVSQSAPSRAFQYGTNYNCASTPTPSTGLRCDDPVNNTGWATAPYTMSTITIDTIGVQVLDGGAWHYVRRWDLTYAKDTPFSVCYPGPTFAAAACAGEHILTSIQEYPYQSDTAMPSRQPLTFGYTSFTKNEYHDTTQLDTSGNPYDAQTWWQYLNSFYDQETGASGTLSYATAYGNTHGVTAGNVLDPTTCDTASNCGTSWNWPDDRQWPRQVVTSITDRGTGDVTNFSYRLNQACGTNCTQDSWIPPNGFNACGDNGLPPTNPNQACLTGGYASYYNEEFTGFNEVLTTHPDSSTNADFYSAGAGWGTNDWDNDNRLRGQPSVDDTYQAAAAGTPLKEVRHSYSDGTPTYCVTTSGNNQLYKNPYLMCEVFEQQRDTYIGGNSSTANVPHYIEKWTYYPGWTTSVNHFYEQLSSSSVSGNDLLADSFTPVSYGTTQPTFTTNYTYAWHDGALDSPVSQYYVINQTAQQSMSDSASPSTSWSCTRSSYDGLGYTTGQTTGLTAGLVTRTDTYTTGICGDSPNSITTGSGYDAYGQKIVTTDADALASVSGHTRCPAPVTPLVVYPAYVAGSSTYTTCSTYGTSQSAYVTDTGNALNKHSTATFDVVQGVQLSSTDPNNAVTTTPAPVYEYSGTPASLTNYLDQYSATTLPPVPGAAPWTTRVYTYSFCATTSVSETRPCMETDTVSQLDGTNLTVKREFYDHDGRLVETRSSGPDASTDVVTITSYDDVHDKQFTSVPCSVAALTTSNGGRTNNQNLTGYVAPAQSTTGSAAYVDPTSTASGTCYNPVGTTSYQDAMGRTIATDDALGTGTGTSGSGCILGSVHHTTCTTYTPVLASTTSGLPSTDTEPYLQAVTVDPNLHQSAVYTDARGKTAYTQRFTGSNQAPLGTGIASYAVVSYQYDPTGNQRVITDPGGHTITYTYDKAGRKTGMTDPDLGTWTYAYDQNGNLTSSVDPRGAGSSATTLVGDTTIEANLDTNSAGSAEAFSYTASTNGTAATFSLYLDSSNTATQVKVGIYTDTGSNAPGTLLAQANITSPVAGAWNTVILPGATVTAGTKYWLAMLAPSGSGTVAFRDCATCSGSSQSSLETTLTTLPGTWSPGTGWTTSSMSAYITGANSSSGTIYIGYDGLNRQLWRNSSNTLTGAYATASYDTGTNGIGRQTGETFNGSDTYGGGSYSYTYDARGQRTAQSITIENHTYGFSFGYDDAGHQTSQMWSDNETTTTGYSPTGWLTSVATTPSGGTATNLLTGISYSGVGGLSMHPTSASVAGGTYSFGATYDNDLRLTSNSLAKVSPSTTLFSSNRTYDAASNITRINTTLAAGTDNQDFCYDEQNRLTTAGAIQLPPNIGCVTDPSPLAAANYSQSYAYDTLGRLTTGPAGTYTYGDSAHLHAVTSTSNGYGAAYDTAGDMLCRAPTSGTTCSGTQTGAQLTYDPERRATHWQNTPSSPTSIDDLRYDGEGTRIEQRAVSGGTTTTTYYLLGGQEEVQLVSGGATTITKNYPTGAGTHLPQPIKVGTTISYLATDGLDTVSEAVDSAGNVTAQQLYLPYGGSRYSSGTMPTSKGYTGQRADAATGLDYYGARYYDPVLGQFTSADDVLPDNGLDPWGLSRYAYVEGNPISKNDPSGHCPWCIGFVVGAIVGAAIAYGVQVYANVQSGKAKGWDAFTTNIDPSLIVMGAVDGALIGASLGVGIAVAGAAIGEGATVGTAAYLGGSAAATDYFYGTYRAGQIEEGDDNEFTPLTKPASGAGDCGESFSSDTLVTTPTGETTIGQLQVGDPVVAYDPQAKATSTQHVEHVFIDHDTDLLDLTLHKDQTAKTASTAADSQSGRSSKDEAANEVVHTTASHPWLTADSGWVRAGKLHVGERVVRADGSSVVVAAIQIIPGAANMYDLTVSNLHTFIVGTGHYVVHNCAKSSFPPASAEPPVFNDPTQSPGPDWEWRGRGTPADGRGNWYNPNTFEKWNPDLSHPLPIGPHWDYSFDGMPGKGWRFMPDRTYVPK